MPEELEELVKEYLEDIEYQAPTIKELDSKSRNYNN